jgi:hypothetical protein
MSETDEDRPEGGSGGEAAEGGGNARERREARRFADMMRQNQEARREVELLRSRLAEAEEAGFKARAAGIDREIAEAEREALRTFSDGDPEGHVKAVRSLAETAARKVTEGNRAPVAKSNSAPAGVQYTKTTKAWIDANPWFRTDPDATATAMAADRVATQTKGLVADTPEYWAFISDAVNSVHEGLVQEPEGFRRPSKKDGGDGQAGADHAAGSSAPDPAAAAAAGRPSAAGGAAPVSRGAPASRPGGDLRLTAEQLDAAKVAGVTPQEYLAYLNDGLKSGAFIPAVGRR